MDLLDFLLLYCIFDGFINENLICFHVFSETCSLGKGLAKLFFFLINFVYIFIIGEQIEQMHMQRIMHINAVCNRSDR